MRLETQLFEAVKGVMVDHGTMEPQVVLIRPSPIHPLELGRRHLLSRIIQPITVGVAGVSNTSHSDLFTSRSFAYR